MSVTWLLLGLAIASELIGTTALKLSDGATKPAWIGVTVIGYGLAFWLLAVVVRTMPLGLAYGVWAGLGTLGAFLISIKLFKSEAQPVAWVGVALVIGGVLLLNAGSESH